jgi:hypothetical protein
VVSKFLFLFILRGLDFGQVEGSWGRGRANNVNRGLGKGELDGMAVSAISGGAMVFLALAAVGWRVGGLGTVGKVVGKS